MEVEHLLQYFKDNGEELRKSILEGKYRPKRSAHDALKKCKE